ncbi:MAG TPA: hypothetical protein VNO70_01195 [Blastocatellia bacterium]|nr:hypothetical protein [Blastocatellia bacterium]
MRVGGYAFKDHVQLLLPLFALITAVWLLRLALDAAGVASVFVRAFSVTGAASLSVLLAVVLIHRQGIGSYPNVVLSAFLLITWGQLLIVVAILFSVLTGVQNVYAAPEFSVPGDDQYHLRHILGHLTFGVGAGTLFGAAAGCLVLWLLRMLVPMRPRV